VKKCDEGEAVHCRSSDAATTDIFIPHAHPGVILNHKVRPFGH
jgi:hypothetical protein